MWDILTGPNMQIKKWKMTINLKRKKNDQFYLRFQEKWEQWAISLANKIPSNDRDIARVDRFELK